MQINNDAPMNIQMVSFAFCLTTFVSLRITWEKAAIIIIQLYKQMKATVKDMAYYQYM